MPSAKLVLSMLSVKHIMEGCSYHISAIYISQVYDYIHLGTPILKLSLPGNHCWQGNHNKKGTIELVGVIQYSQHTDCLNCLTETHFVSKDDTILPEMCKLWMHKFVCSFVLRPSQPNGVMSSTVSLPNSTFTGQA